MAGSFERVLGKKRAPLDSGQLAGLVGNHEPVVIDLGTGDGRFVLDLAREDPSTLVIGIDPVPENMAESARKAAGSPKKGGAPNAVFIRGAAERMPGPFLGVADLVTVNYPWGSLMRIVAEPVVEDLRKLRSVCKPGADLRVHLNQAVLADREYLERLGMETIGDPRTDDGLIEAYAAAGFVVHDRSVFAGDPPFRSRWARQLIRGSARETLLIEASAGENTL